MRHIHTLQFNRFMRRKL